jgi:hypothetical protein
MKGLTVTSANPFYVVKAIFPAIYFLTYLFIAYICPSLYP